MGAPQGWQGAAMPGIQSPGSNQHPGLARQNTCLSASCSTDLTITAIRPPKFLDGNEPTGPMSRASLNAGAVAGETHFRSFPHASPCFVRRPSSAGHTGILLRHLSRLFENAPAGRLFYYLGENSPSVHLWSRSQTIHSSGGTSSRTHRVPCGDTPLATAR